VRQVVLEGVEGAVDVRRELAAALKRRGPSLIEVPVGEMPDPWPTLIMPRVRGR
jgi:acetolactate synthase-1/2/3 large subunit